jgi:signal transduction histidine kinase
VAAVQRIVWRISAPAIGLAALLLVVTLVASWMLWLNQRTANSVLRETLQTAQASEQLEETLRGMRDELLAYRDTGDERHLNNALGLRDQTDRLIYEIERYSIDGQPLFMIIRRRYAGLEGLFPSNRSDPRTIGRDMVGQVLDENLSDDMMEDAARHRRARMAQLEQAMTDGAAATSYLRSVLLLLGLGGATAGVLAGWGIAQGVHQSLVELSVPVRNAAGSLKTVVGPVQVRGDGNISDLEASLSELSEKVSTVVERLQAAERESLRSEQMAALGQLAAGLAHELRNPLTAIQTLVEAARSGAEGGRLEGQDLAVLEEEITRLNESIQSFLDYARPPKLERRPVDLREIVQRTRQLLAARADRQEIQLAAQLPDQPVTVNADAEQMRQVLLNLVLNAFDAVGHNGSVTMEVSPQSNGQALLQVADSGPGIPDSIRERLFEPFVSSKESGTGLGLTICRRIVEQHGGTIVAANRPEGGAVFSVRLPA